MVWVAIPLGKKIFLPSPVSITHVEMLRKGWALLTLRVFVALHCVQYLIVLMYEQILTRFLDFIWRASNFLSLRKSAGSSGMCQHILLTPIFLNNPGDYVEDTVTLVSLWMRQLWVP